jgi:hypothetical protein
VAAWPARRMHMRTRQTASGVSRQVRVRARGRDNAIRTRRHLMFTVHDQLDVAAVLLISRTALAIMKHKLTGAQFKLLQASDVGEHRVISLERS